MAPANKRSLSGMGTSWGGRRYRPGSENAEEAQQESDDDDQANDVDDGVHECAPLGGQKPMLGALGAAVCQPSRGGRVGRCGRRTRKSPAGPGWCEGFEPLSAVP